MSDGPAVGESDGCCALERSGRGCGVGSSVGTGVAVGGTRVAVGGTGVAVGGTGVLVADGDGVADGLAVAVSVGVGVAVAGGMMTGTAVGVAAIRMRSRTAPMACIIGRSGSGGRLLALVTITALSAVTTARTRAAASKATRWAWILRHQAGLVDAAAASGSAPFVCPLTTTAPGSRVPRAARILSRCVAKPADDIDARGAAYSSWATISKGARRGACSGYSFKHSSTDAPR